MAGVALLRLRVRSLAPTAGGSSLPVFRVVDQRGRRFALRLGSLAAAPILDREARNLQAAAALGIPCPTVVRRADDGVVSTLLTSWEPGVPMGHALQANPAALPDLARQAGRLQARIHALGTGVPTADLGQGWARPASAAESEAYEACPDDGPMTLLHLDFHPLNLLVHRRRISAVLDWVNAGLGDARRDVARTAAILALDVVPPTSPLRGLVDEMLRNWLRGYEDVAGKLRDMRPYMVWAGHATIRDIEAKRPWDHIAAMRTVVASWQEGRGSVPGVPW